MSRSDIESSASKGFMEDDTCDNCVAYELERGQPRVIAEKVCDLRINFTKQWYNWGRNRSKYKIDTDI